MKFIPLALLFFATSAQAGLTCSDYLANPEPARIADYLIERARTPVRHKPLGDLAYRLNLVCTPRPAEPMTEVLRYIEYISDKSWKSGNGWIVYSKDIELREQG